MPAFRSPRRKTYAPRLDALEDRLPRRRLMPGGGLKNPLWARAGGSSMGGPLPGGRLTRGALVLVTLGLSGLGGRWFIGQRIDFAGQIERAARRQYLPQLERQIGQKIEVGSFETDWLGRVVVNDVVVGRNQKSPLGALARARRITLGLDLVGLALGRVQALQAVENITVDEPQIFVERDARGQFVLARLFPKRDGAPPLKWNGSVVIHNGRVVLVDASTRPASNPNRPLQVDARGIEAQARFSTQNPLRFAANIGQTLVDETRLDARNVSATGDYNLETRAGLMALELPLVPVAPLSDYAFRNGDVVARGGSIGGRVVLGLQGGKLAQRGDLTLQNVAVTLAKVREPRGGKPNAGAPLRVDNVSGPLRFAGTAFQSSRLTLDALGASWEVAGAASTASSTKNDKGASEPIFDAQISTRALPINRMRTWLAPRALPLDFQSGTTTLNVQIAGTPSRLNASGTVGARDVRLNSLSGPNWNARVPQLRAVFVAATAPKTPARFAVRASVPHARAAGSTRLAGSVRDGIFDARNLQITARGAAGNAPLEVALGAASWRFNSRSLGQSAGRNIRVHAFRGALKNGWRGDFGVQNASTNNLRRTVSPELGRFLGRSGILDASGEFTGIGTARPRLSGTTALSFAEMAPAIVPVAARRAFGEALPSGALQLRDLRARVSLFQGQFAVSDAQAQSELGLLRASATANRFALEVPDVRLSSNRFDGFLRARGLAAQGDWRGRLRVAGAPGNSGFDARFALYSSRAGVRNLAGETSTRAGLEQVRLEGAVRVRPNAPPDARWIGNATLRAEELNVGAGRLGTIGASVPPALDGARLRGAIVVVNASPRTWTARLDGNRLALPLGGVVRGAAGSITFLSPSLVAQNGRGFSDVRLTRASARFGAGRIDATAGLEDGQMRARLLARELDAGALQTLLARSSRQTARLSGRFNALVTLDPNRTTRFEVQMARGELRLPATGLASMASSTKLFSTRSNARIAPPSRSGALARSVETSVVSSKLQFGTSRLEEGVSPATFSNSGADALFQSGCSKRFLIASETPESLPPLPPLRLPAASSTKPAPPARPKQIQPRLPARSITPRAVSPLRLPLRNVRLSGEIAGNRVRLANAWAWSETARIDANGAFQLGARGAANLAGSGRLSVAGLRLTRVPLAAQLRTDAAPDGFVDGSFAWKIGASSELNGQARLRSGTVLGADIERAAGQVTASRDSSGWRVRLAKWRGRIEDADFRGEFETDTAQNYWRLNLETPRIGARRIGRLRALAAQRIAARGSSRVRSVVDETLPLEGEVFADVDINGTLRPLRGDEASRRAIPFWVPREGYALVTSPSLRWRGRALGALKADVAFEGDLARLRTVELSPPKASGETRGAAPRIALAGVIPLSPDRAGLDATLEVGEAPLEFFVDTLRESREVMAQSGIQTAFFDRAVSYAEALPPGTRGRVALDATFAGRWRNPTVAVPRLTLRDARAPRPQGGLSEPATLDTSFALGNGALTLGATQFRLAKTAAERENPDDDDTLVSIASGARIDPAGEIALQADVLNANLSQLAAWVPALRAANGTPLVRGNLSGFSLTLSGKTLSPDVVGSIQGENLSYGGTSIDRLLLSRFEIKDGQASIAPGNLTVAKGAFQSSAAWGRVPWNWAARGPLRNQPLELHFPLQTRDFGALVGVFVPALSGAAAREFEGSVDVGGTLDSPRLSGLIRIAGGEFRLDGPGAAVPVGVSELDGTLRFVDGNRLVIDESNPFRGRLVGAKTRETKPRDPKIREVSTSSASSAPDVQLAGAWSLGGSVALDLRPQTLADPLRALGRHRYDLQMEIANGAFSSSDIAGARDVAGALRWKTGNDGAQRVRWMLAARGARRREQKGGSGELIGVGALRLRPDFATGFDAIARSDAETFVDEADFAKFAVASRVKVAELPDRRTQFLFKKLVWGVTGVGSGELDGRLVLDERAATQEPPREAVTLQNAQLRPKTPGEPLRVEPLQNGLSAERDVQRERREGDLAPSIPLGAKVLRDFPGFFSGFQNRRAETESEFVDEGDTPRLEPIAPRDALRLGGLLTLNQTEITGAPAGGDGLVRRLGLFPGAPRFDVRVRLGEDVEFVTSALRARLAGELVASGTPNNPQILGTLRTRDGEVRFPNARARIEQGRFAVAIGRDPQTDTLASRLEVDVTARGQAGRYQTTSLSPSQNGSGTPRSRSVPYQITLRLRGPLDLSGGNAKIQNLNVDVTSNPPLSQSEAFAQLLGVSVRDSSGRFDSGDANEAYARAVLQVVSAPLFAGVERSLAQALGLDNVGFEYRFNEPLAIALSKSLGDRVLVSYRRSVGGTNGYGTPFELRIDYRLKGNLLLGLQTDERDIRSLTLQKSWRF